MARFKNLRLDDELQRLITARMVATGSKDESATIREILLDGLKSPRRPVLAQLGSREEVLKFAQLTLAWQQAFQSVRARLAMAMPDPDDTKLCALVDKWRALADELEPQARALSQTAAALAKALLGLSPEDCATLAEAKQMLLGLVRRRQEALANPAISAANKDTHEKTLRNYEAILRAVSIFGI